MRASRMLRRLAEVRHVPRYVEDQRLSEPEPRRIVAGYDVVPRGASTTHTAFDELSPQRPPLPDRPPARRSPSWRWFRDAETPLAGDDDDTRPTAHAEAREQEGLE